MVKWKFQKAKDVIELELKNSSKAAWIKTKQILCKGDNTPFKLIEVSL